MSNNAVWIQVKTADWAEWKDEAVGNSPDASWKAWVEEIKSWPGVEKIWSTSGQWDWIVKLTNDSSSWEGAKKIMWKLKEHKWVSDTNTWWSEEF